MHSAQQQLAGVAQWQWRLEEHAPSLVWGLWVGGVAVSAVKVGNLHRPEPRATLWRALRSMRSASREGEGAALTKPALARPAL